VETGIRPHHHDQGHAGKTLCKIKNKDIKVGGGIENAVMEDREGVSTSS